MIEYQILIERERKIRHNSILNQNQEFYKMSTLQNQSSCNPAFILGLAI